MQTQPQLNVEKTGRRSVDWRSRSSTSDKWTDWRKHSLCLSGLSDPFSKCQSPFALLAVIERNYTPPRFNSTSELRLPSEIRSHSPACSALGDCLSTSPTSRPRPRSPETQCRGSHTDAASTIPSKSTLKLCTSKAHLDGMERLALVRGAPVRRSRREYEEEFVREICDGAAEFHQLARTYGTTLFCPDGEGCEAFLKRIVLQRNQLLSRRSKG
mmetsp:Transcript_21790/g.36004  ORF Transcript_21790/g.36004 Transcript_21790/m.36004 type:complete len:214 (+) Transcript_21790:113-754(+)